MRNTITICLVFISMSTSVSHRLGRDFRRGQQPDDSLSKATILAEIHRFRTFKPFVVPELESLSSPSKPDVLVFLDPYQKSVMLATVDPADGQPGFCEGIDFIFYFEGTSIQEVHSMYWVN